MRLTQILVDASFGLLGCFFRALGLRGLAFCLFKIGVFAAAFKVLSTMRELTVSISNLLGTAISLAKSVGSFTVSAASTGRASDTKANIRKRVFMMRVPSPPA